MKRVKTRILSKYQHFRDTQRKIGEGHWKREEGGRGLPEESDSLENKNNNSGRGYSMSKILEGQGKKRAKCSLH